MIEATYRFTVERARWSDAAISVLVIPSAIKDRTICSRRLRGLGRPRGLGWGAGMWNSVSVSSRRLSCHREAGRNVSDGTGLARSRSWNLSMAETRFPPATREGHAGPEADIGWEGLLKLRSGCPPIVVGPLWRARRGSGATLGFDLQCGQDAVDPALENLAAVALQDARDEASERLLRLGERSTAPSLELEDMHSIDPHGLPGPSDLG